MAEKSWRPSRKKYGVAIANFHGKVRHGLPLTVGDTVHILEEYGSDDGGWYRGVSFSNKEQKGIFPKCLIAEKESQVDNPGCYETVTPIDDPIIQELTFGLREWLQTWKSKYLDMGWCTVLDRLQTTMIELSSMRGRLINASVSTEQKKDLKDEIVTLIDWGNGQLGMDLVPRKEGEQLDADKTSIVELHRVHVQSAENAKSAEPRRTPVNMDRNSKEAVSLHNILVMFKASQCNIGEAAFIYVSVYNSKDDKFVSEQFEIEMNKNGLPAYQEKIGSMYALFTDISSDEMSRNLYLVARIYRYGKMLSDNSNKKAPQTPYRRPWGVGVLSLDEVKGMTSTTEDFYESVLKVQSCVDNEGSFSELHKNLINRQSSLGQSSKGGSTTVMSSDKQNLGVTFAVRIIPGELKTVQAENPLLFTKGVAIIQKLDFSDIITPGEVRNDLYITLSKGEFERDGKKSQKNVEVKLTVYDHEGKQIKECISAGTTDKAQLADGYYSSCYYHNNQPKWGETVRVSIPMDVFPGSHVRFDVYHCSRNTSRGKAEKRLCGFSFMRLTDTQQIVIQDASHSLCVYKCEDVGKIKYLKYKSLPFLSDDFNDPRTPAFQHSGKNSSLPYQKTNEQVHVITKLCSTKFTQTSQLLGILLWKENQVEIESNLDKMMKLQGLEIMKFLQDILDKIFDMLTEGSSGKCLYCTKVFHALVFILNLLLDSRFENFVPVLDNYLQVRFSFPVVHKYLTESFAEGIQKAVSGDHFPVAMSLKVLDQLVRFIVRSRELEQSTSVFKRVSDPEAEFLKRIQDLFNSFGALLTNRESRLKISQMALLANLHKSFEPLSLVLRKSTIAQFVVQVMTQKHKDMPDDVARNKMEFIKEVINAELFMDQESRQILLPMCLSQVKWCLVEKNFLQLAAGSLGDMLDKLFILKVGNGENIRKEVTKVTESLFQILIDTTLTLSEKVVPAPVTESASTSKLPDVSPRKGSCVSMEDMGISGEMIACMAEMLRLMDERHYSSIVQKYKQPNILRDFLTKVLLTFQELIKEEAFPADWTMMRLVTNHVIFVAVEYFCDTLRSQFLHGDRFNEALWNHYFNLAVSFITQPSLQLEVFSSAKRQKVKDRYQDMRVLMGQQIQMLWENLGKNRRHFIPSMIGPFLKVTLVPEEELRKATLPIFYDMMECEQKTSGNFLMVENEIIERLDQYITMEGYGDEAYRELFKRTLLDKVQTEPDLQDKGSQFILSVTSLLDRLLDYRSVYDGDENSDKRMHCTFNILNFYKDNNNREEMYVRYIKKLYDLHLSAQNYVEAGLTLQLYAQILQFRDTLRKDELDYPQQPEWERKEKVYLQVIDCFDRGKVWEYGIPLCKELAELYERRLDYRKLSNILEKQAKFFSNILDGVEVMDDGGGRPTYYPRQEPTYFRVAYYGQSFPPFVRNKAFIYRGDECLKLQDIINHMLQEFPTATILSTNNPVDEAMKLGQAQHIQICPVKPLGDDRPEFVKCGGSVPAEIKNFYNSNDVDTFQLDRSFHRGEKDKSCEFKTLCTERTIMRTNYRFPGILQWYEVVQTDVVVLSPVYTAIENIRTATQSLQKETDLCKKNASLDTVKSLSMKLQGMISANVNGGIPKYQEAFFLPDYTFLHPEEADGVNQLKHLITEQVMCLDRGMSLMKQVNKVRGAGLSELLKSLSELLKDLKRTVGLNTHDRISSVVSTIGGIGRPDSGMGSMFLDTSGVETPGSGSIHSSGSNRSSMLSGDTLSQDGDLYDEPPTELKVPVRTGSDPNIHKPPELPQHKGHTGITSSVSTGQLNKPVEPPKITRNDSAPSVSSRPKIISRRPTDVSSRTINGEERPALPLKKKPSMEQIPENVPPLPPRKVSTSTSRVSAAVANFSGHGHSPEPPVMRKPQFTKSPSNNSDSSDNVFDVTEAPPIPVRRSKGISSNMPPTPAPRISHGKDHHDHEQTKM